MAIISISEAAQQWQVDQAILYQKIKNGDLIMSARSDGTRGIDTNEMVKIFGVAPTKSKKSVLSHEQVLHGKRSIKVSPIPPIPDNVTSESIPMGLRITYNWLTWQSAILVCGYILNCFMIIYFFLPNLLGIDIKHFTISNIMEAIRNTSNKAILILVSMLMIGFIYKALGILINNTIITVTKHNILVRHGPLPWFRNRRIDVSDINQLYCEEYYGATSNRGRRTLYRVCAVLNNCQKIKLVTGIDSHDVAIFLEDEIEAWLGIKDRPVAGEL